MKIRSRLAIITIALLGTTATLVSCGGEKEDDAKGAADAAEGAAEEAADKMGDGGE